jgi:hypothetical protein
MATSKPCSANCLANSKPMPLEPPVTIASLFFPFSTLHPFISSFVAFYHLELAP